MARWHSVEDAIQAGKDSELSRVYAGIPLMLRYSSLINQHREDIPFGLLIVKGAFESKGNPVTRSAIDSRGRRAVGLFQLYIGVQDLSESELQNPEINTIAFVRLMQDRADGFEKTHGQYFPSGRDRAFWDVVMWSTMIGPGAVRTILDASGPSKIDSFERAINYVKKNPRWLEDDEIERKFGIQGGRLVAFRSVVFERMAAMARIISPAGVTAGLGAGAAALAILLGVLLLWR